MYGRELALVCNIVGGGHLLWALLLLLVLGEGLVVELAGLNASQFWLCGFVG
jgi:hypothetical protein